MLISQSTPLAVCRTDRIILIQIEILLLLTGWMAGSIGSVSGRKYIKMEVSGYVDDEIIRNP